MNQLAGLRTLALVTVLSACVQTNVSSPERDELAGPNITTVRCKDGDCEPEKLWDWGPLATGGGGPGCDYETLRARDTNKIGPPSGNLVMPQGGFASDCDPVPNLICEPANVNWMQNTSCNYTVFPIPPGSTIQVTGWQFTGEGVVVFRGAVPGPWSGPMITSGTVTVFLTVNGNPYTPSAQVSVNRRSPAWGWQGQVGGRAGTPGEIDACIADTLAGKTAGVSCSGSNPNSLFTPAPKAAIINGSGYSAQQVQGGGPNGTLWYLSAASATMALRTQIHKDYRSDGPTHAMNGDPVIVNACGNTNPRNVFTVNTACMNVTGFANAVAHIWSHEGSHLSVAINAAKSGSGNLHALWEPLVANNPATLQVLAQDEYNAAELFVFNQANTIHTGAVVAFQHWWFFTPAGGQLGWWSYNYTLLKPPG